MSLSLSEITNILRIAQKQEYPNSHTQALTWFYIQDSLYSPKTATRPVPHAGQCVKPFLSHTWDIAFLGSQLG